MRWRKQPRTVAEVDSNLLIAAREALKAFEGEEDSVKREHKRVINRLRKAVYDSNDEADSLS